MGDSAMLECEQCRAVWIDAATFEHICASRETQAAVLHHWTGPEPAGAASGPVDRAGRSTAAKPAEIRYRKCVACGTMMNRLNFGRLSGTIVDACRGHGTLLDAGELHSVVRFIQGGGLDRARQRQIEDMKEQEQRLRQAQAMRPGPGGDMSTDPGWSGFDLQSLLDQLKR